MAAVGRLMASLAHEINNPLQAVRNCLHLATRKGIDNEQHYHYLKLTDGELDRLVTTVRRMLDFYRPGSAEKASVEIRQIIDKVIALLDPQLRQRVAALGRERRHLLVGRVLPRAERLALLQEPLPLLGELLHRRQVHRAAPAGELPFHLVEVREHVFEVEHGSGM
jgi:signal transduction histidine kinase